MIKNLNSNSPFLMVSPNTVPWIYNNGALSGQLRVNQSQDLEIYDGNQWHRYSQTIDIGLNQAAERAIQWAIDKMEKEKDREAKMEKYPALKAAYEHYKTVECLVSEETY